MVEHLIHKISNIKAVNIKIMDNQIKNKYDNFYFPK